MVGLCLFFFSEIRLEVETSCGVRALACYQIIWSQLSMGLLSELLERADAHWIGSLSSGYQAASAQL